MDIVVLKILMRTFQRVMKELGKKRIKKSPNKGDSGCREILDGLL
jgi:hypothetical protein